MLQGKRVAEDVRVGCWARLALHRGDHFGDLRIDASVHGFGVSSGLGMSLALGVSVTEG